MAVIIVPGEVGQRRCSSLLAALIVALQKRNEQWDGAGTRRLQLVAVVLAGKVAQSTRRCLLARMTPMLQQVH